MGVKTLGDSKRTEQLTIRLPVWTYEALVFIAQAEKSSLNRQINVLLEPAILEWIREKRYSLLDEELD